MIILDCSPEMKKESLAIIEIINKIELEYSGFCINLMLGLFNQNCNVPCSEQQLMRIILQFVQTKSHEEIKIQKNDSKIDNIIVLLNNAVSATVKFSTDYENASTFANSLRDLFQALSKYFKVDQSDQRA